MTTCSSWLLGLCLLLQVPPPPRRRVPMGSLTNGGGRSFARETAELASLAIELRGRERRRSYSASRLRFPTWPRPTGRRDSCRFPKSSLGISQSRLTCCRRAPATSGNGRPERSSTSLRRLGIPSGAVLRWRACASARCSSAIPITRKPAGFSDTFRTTEAGQLRSP